MSLVQAERLTAVPVAALGAAQGVGGVALLGVAAPLAATDPAAMLWAPLLNVALLVAPALLTGPGLLVLGAFIGAELQPADVAGALSEGARTAGRYALGLAPVVLFAAATTTWGPLVGLGALVWALGEALAQVRGLLRAAAPPTRSARALIDGWVLLSSLIALRIGAWLIAAGGAA